MTVALIAPDGVTITQIEDDVDQFDVHPSYEWVSVAADTVPYEDTWDGAAVVKFVPPTADEILEAFLAEVLETTGESQTAIAKVLTALILAINDGTFVPGSNHTKAQLRTGLKNLLNSTFFD